MRYTPGRPLQVERNALESKAARLSSAAGINHAVAHGQQGQLDIAGDRQLFEDAIAVGIHGFRRQAELVGDGLNLLAAGNHQRDLDFTLGEQIERRIAALWLERLEGQLLSDLRADITLATEHHADGLNHFFQSGTFGQVTSSTGLQQARRERIFFADGNRNDFEVGMAANQFARSFEAADTRHLDVHQDNIGLQFAGFLQGFFAGLGLTNYMQAVDISQHTGDAGTYQVVVINN